MQALDRYFTTPGTKNTWISIKSGSAFGEKSNPASLGRENPTVEVDSLNSSGTLLSNTVFTETGGFDSGLFIDHVETDWCFKAKSLGYKLFGTINTQLTHHMGDDVCYYWLLKKRRMPYRSPARHYYIVRNSVLLQKRSYVPIAWKISNVLKLCFTFCYFGCYYQGPDTTTQTDTSRLHGWSERCYRGLRTKMNQTGHSRRSGPAPG